ncbi:hypothetical protein ACTU7N_000534 [Listeria monocytogenes]|nr:hypothetical protein [Listeria monocytogenes]EAF1671386.1 hypothetical protein [Listeria monocytogenes]ELC2202378.1 hypothetical protein [Listeria monocytogenes]HAC4847712.1 hypothetical protein [Listeria monocytogenes]
MQYIEFFNHICQETILKDYIFRKLLGRRKRVRADKRTIIPSDAVIYTNNTCFLREIHFQEKIYYDLLDGENYLFVTNNNSKVVLIPLVNTEYIFFNKEDLFTLLETDGVLSCLYLNYVKKMQEGIRFNLRISEEETEIRICMLLDKVFRKQDVPCKIPTALSVQNMAIILGVSCEDIEKAIRVLKSKGYIKKREKRLVYYSEKVRLGKGVLEVD